jgi:phospholipid/cholesterol/gamma-HCH transport system substrate-binding protein
MALQDLTPQLRTRLSRMERAVGWFVLVAAGLLLFGFVYYIYNTAERKGWFKTKAPFFTFADRATGLKIGDPVRLMGLDVGQITKMEPMPPENFQYNMYVEFELKDPYYGYLWTEGSRAKVTTADLLGKRVLEVTKGTGGYPAYVFYPLRVVNTTEAEGLPEFSRWVFGEEIASPNSSNALARALGPLTNLASIAAAGHTRLVVLDTREQNLKKTMTGMWDDHQGRYEPYTNKVSKYWLLSDESPAVTERLERLVGEVEKALPNILNLTNQLASVLSNSSSLTSNLNEVAMSARPVVSNLALATAQLDRPGALGEWLLPTNINRELEGTLRNASSAVAKANSNVTALAENLERTLDNLANLTSNLNGQVQANTNLVGALSRAIVDTDDLVQGLKRHWLLRSAFKKKAPPAKAPPPPKTAPSKTPHANVPVNPSGPSEKLSSPKDQD